MAIAEALPVQLQQFVLDVSSNTIGDLGARKFAARVPDELSRLEGQFMRDDGCAVKDSRTEVRGEDFLGRHDPYIHRPIPYAPKRDAGTYVARRMHA